MYRRGLRLFTNTVNVCSAPRAWNIATQPRLLATQHTQEEHYRSNQGSRNIPRVGLLAVGFSALGGIVLANANYREDVPINLKDIRYSNSQLFNHFYSFASYKYENEVFMSGNDFLRAVLDKDHYETPDRTSPIIELSEAEQMLILQEAPLRIKKAGIFTSLGSRALISFPEYLFLVSILSHPKNHLMKIFHMIDVDGNRVLDKKEFELLGSFFGGVEFDSPNNTSLKVHFFKEDGSGVLTSKAFVHFIDSLQAECLKVEFNEYTRGKKKLSDTAFTRLLLDRTTLEETEKSIYIKRVEQRSYGEENITKIGVTFPQYKQFMDLLNNIHDLEMTLRLFHLAKKPVTPDEFGRAVKVCTGIPLSSRMVELAFKIFDADGDGSLSHDEFVKVMKDRLQSRGIIDQDVRDVVDGSEIVDLPSESS